ncbi:D-alanyl-D-alanine carboxypeptidase family protein [Actinokineospora sp. NPDC004072]
MTDRLRDWVYRVVTRGVAVVLVPVAWVVAPGRVLETAARWALALRYPAEDLNGLTHATRVAVTAARTQALWRAGVLIGVTSGFRTAQVQERLFDAEVRLRGSVAGARRRVLPAAESRHVAGTAVDVRPMEGARWLERFGGRFGLFRVYDNEWWHFEFHAGGAPPRLPHPGLSRVELR